ncbi:MAG: sigma-70 family RNA polymerase sigma factor [Myxococcales bacterium]|nr:sigma-70 family RNA polymerase sigma factor [Myxococcales bacterium]MCB9647786.1 sigma-70 family RNA polymerase sigma factor [Deltaproteobacteria bacterium]
MSAVDPDTELVSRAREGDERAMERLYRRHSDVIYAYALRVTAHADAAEDVVQETFVRAFRGLPSFEGRSTFRTWLFSIAMNRARTALKRGANRREAPLSDRVAAPEAPPDGGWVRRQLTDALASLPEGYREVVVLHDVLELEHQEIAELRKCSVGTSKSQLHKARARLRTLLAPAMGGQDA